MPFFRDMSINRKLTLIIMVTVSAALTVACIVFFSYDYYTARRQMVNALSGDARIIATNGGPAMIFDDSDSAEEILSALSAHEDIVWGAMYTPDRKRFAVYRRGEDDMDIPDPALPYEGHRFAHGRVLLFQPMLSEGERIGTVFISAELRQIRERMVQYAVTTVSIMAISFIAALLLSQRLKRVISGPISELVRTAEQVSSEKDYSVRATKQSDDELGLVVLEFNRMLDMIERRDAELEQAHAVLEDKVRERTRSLRTSEKRYRNLFNTMMSAFALHEIICDKDGTPIDYRFLEVNPSFEKMTGVSAKDVVGKRLLDIFPDTERSWIETYGKVALTGESVRFEEYAGALEKHFEVFLYSPEKGKLATVFSDITSRKLAEDAQVRLATAVEQAVEAIMITDTDGTIQYVNPAFKRITGYSEEESVGRTANILKSGEHKDAFYKEVWNTITGGDVWSGTFINKTKDGTLFEWESTVSPVRNSTGRIVNYVAVNRDVTEQTLLENQLRQAQKMEAIGQLAGGVAHDFNNLLTGILGYANIIKSNAQLGDSVHKGADVIEVAAKRAARLTEQLLGFARKGKHQNVPVDLHDTVREAIDLLNRTIDKRISIKQHFHVEKATVLGDPGQMQQVLLNLAINARDAMPTGGDLVFETNLVDIDETFCKTHPGTVPGKYIMASVSDTGCGISDNVRERIFEPFFTTKEIGKGTGMGLAMVYGIVKNHKGSIWVYSEVDRGTIVKVYFPVFGTAETSNESVPEGEIKHGSGRIILVDDEEVVRDVAAAMLETIGYDVIQAAGGQDAVELFKDNHDTIDLAIIDMIMPKMGGRECFLAFREIDPNMRAILSTGFGLDGAAQEIIDLGMQGFIQKPYVLRELSNAVARVMDKPPH